MGVRVFAKVILAVDVCLIVLIVRGLVGGVNPMIQVIDVLGVDLAVVQVHRLGGDVWLQLIEIVQRIHLRGLLVVGGQVKEVFLGFNARVTFDGWHVDYCGGSRLHFSIVLSRCCCVQLGLEASCPVLDCEQTRLIGGGQVGAHFYLASSGLEAGDIVEGRSVCRSQLRGEEKVALDLVRLILVAGSKLHHRLDGGGSEPRRLLGRR